jgi:hypothetical protein
MNRRKFIQQSIGASIAGPVVINELSMMSGNRLYSDDLPSIGIKSPQETKLIVKPIMTNMYHTDVWEGPCRFNVIPTEKEKKNALDSFETFKTRISEKEYGIKKEDVTMLDPSLLLFVEDFKLKEEDLKKIDADASAADALLIDPSGSSVATYDLAARYKKPVVIAWGLNCRTVDISAYCRSKGLEVFIPDSRSGINDIMTLLRARKILSQTRILYPTDWGWPSVASVAGINEPYGLKEKFGVELIKVSYDELSSAVESTRKNANDMRMAEEMAEYVYKNAEKSFIDKKYVTRSLEFYLSVINLMRKHDCNAFTIECFEFCTSRLPQKWQITPCLIHTMFKDLGIPSACEGDLGGLLSMHLLMSLSKKSSHMGNMFLRDNGVMEINHSATGIRMNGYNEPPLKYQLGKFVESGWGTKAVVDYMQTEEKDITVARMNPQATGLLVLNGKLVGSKGADEDLPGCSVSAFIVGKESGTAEEFIRKQSDYGNHLVWVYGDYTAQLERLGKLIGLQVEVCS